MEELQSFLSTEFGRVRTISKNEKIFFCGKDIATALGYKNVTDALQKHCKLDGVAKRDLTDNLGRTQQATFINEANLYRLICNSNLPNAERFEKWVFEEIMPSIRKHGAYATAPTIENILANPDNGIKLLQALKDEQDKRKALEQKVEQDKPKIAFTEAVNSSTNSILIRDLAKLIASNGVDIGEKRLFNWLRINGYLMVGNTPTQRAVDSGWLELKEHSIVVNGNSRTTFTTKVTGKGQIYFVNKFVSIVKGTR